MKDATTIHFDMGKFADGGSCRPWGQHNHLDLMAVVVPFRLQELAGIRDSNLKRQPRNWGGTNSGSQKHKPIFRRLDLTR